MAEKKIIEITEEGYAAVLAEYNNLKDVLIPANIQALQDARSQGDLSENADYDAARDEQARLNARSLELENIIKNHKIIEVDKSKKVSIGKNVNKISANAFSGCKKLNKVTIKSATISSFGANSFKGTGKKISFKVPKSALKKYTAKIRKTGVSKKSVISK